MNSKKSLQLLLILGTAVFMLGTLWVFRQIDLPIFGAKHHSDLIAQNTNTYLGPNERLPNQSELIRIQVLVYNDPDPKGARIVSAEFEGTNIPLKPGDIYGYRGQASFQKQPGKYKLRWVIERDARNWPRTVQHEEEVLLDPRDLWIQISIIGNQAEIS